MKKILIGLGALVALVLAAAGVFAATLEPSFRPAQSLHTEADETARLARGEYLANDVLACFACHQKRDWGRFAGPPVGPAGVDGDCFDRTTEFPGTLCAANITPHPTAGIGSWSDAEILRAVREGVDHEDQALFSMMPYQAYRHLSDEDGAALVAYLRTLEPNPWQPPPRELDFPVNILFQLDPEPLTGPVPPPADDEPSRGKYLAHVAACQQCHTPVDDTHHHLPGQDFSGGQVFKGPFGTVVSRNITPHPTGLGDMSKDVFIATFRARGEAAQQQAAEKGRNTVMPWATYAGMRDEDLAAIYTYLRSVEPIEREVDPYPR